MPELSPRLLQELERINRARDPEHADRELEPKVYDGGGGQPQLLAEKKARRLLERIPQEVTDHRGAGC